MKSNLQSFTFYVLLCVFVGSGCVETASSSDQPNFSPSQVREIVKSGELEDYAEIEVNPVFACQNQASVVFVVKRARTLEQSVEINWSASAEAGLSVPLLAEVKVVIGAEYGLSRGMNISDGGELQLVVEPGTFPIFTIAWREKWEKGYAVVVEGTEERQIPYRYLRYARPEILETKYIGCDDASLVQATVVSSLATQNAQPTTTPTLIYSSTDTPAPTYVPTDAQSDASNILYSEIENNYENMSREQWSVYSNSLIGVRVHWSGKMVDIAGDNFRVDVGQRSTFRFVYIDEVPAEIIVSLRKEQNIEFEATIYMFIWVLGLDTHLNELKIISLSE